MKISFITTAYNVNKYLDDYFQSFIPLGNIEYEIIFVDDKSPEVPDKIVKKYIKKLPINFIKLKKNIGQGFARNKALKYLSNDTTHVIYIDSDDMLDDHKGMSDIKEGKITWFNSTDFDKKKKRYWNKNKSFGGNFFPNTIWGVAIPKQIALENIFESTKFEDNIINRRLVNKYSDISILSDIPLVAYRRRKSSITGSAPSAEKFKMFVNEMKKLIDEGYNTYRFNIQEIYQYYWMWKKHLKDFDKNILPDTKRIYKFMFMITGSLIRFLRLEKLIYGWGSKNAFD